MSFGSHQLSGACIRHGIDHGLVTEDQFGGDITTDVMPTTTDIEERQHEDRQRHVACTTTIDEVIPLQRNLGRQVPIIGIARAEEEKLVTPYQ